MKKQLVITALLAGTFSGAIAAESYDQTLQERNRKIEEMEDMRNRLSLQTEMSKLYKDMSDAGFIVDENGQPQGIGTIQRLAVEVRRRSALGLNNRTASPNDPFGGADPVIPMGGDYFGATGSQMPLLPPTPAAAAEPAEEKVEVVAKPTTREKEEGKKVLRLVEIRGNSATFFTNEGFVEVVKGSKVYDQRLSSIGVDSVTVDGPDGKRVLRIDWTKSVRYSDD